MTKVGIRELALLCVVASAGACSRPQPTAVVGRSGGPGVLASFTGTYEPATGQLTVRLDPGSTPGGLTILPPVSDGNLDTNPTDTIQIANAPGPGTTGFATDQCPGGVRSFWGDVEIRSFFRYQDLQDVHVEIFEVDSDNVGCASDPAVPGTSSASGLWRYGTIGRIGQPNNALTRRWAFRAEGDTPFTFRGVVKATLSAPVAHGGPEFDWTPAMVAGAQRFAQGGTTLGHLLWNGSTFQDLRGLGVTFTRMGAPGSTYPMIPGAPYASGMTQGNFFVTSPAAGMAGDFTVCARIKPGVHPGDEPSDTSTKVLVARGRAEGAGHEGWALMQMNEAYWFHYRTAQDAAQGVMAALPLPSGSRPERWAYDYVCGGRNGNTVHVGKLGESGVPMAESGTFANAGAALPLAVGAYSDGTRPARDAGVYEMIFDSRPFTQAVVDEILAHAEGRDAVAPATYVPAQTETAFTGADGVSYVLPPYATVPVANDATGLMIEGRTVTYQRPVVEDTSATGLCVGAEVQANGAWSAVQGGVLGLANGLVKVQFGDGTGPGAWRLVSGAVQGAGVLVSSGQGGWDDGSSHTILACLPPTGGTIRLYGDGAEAGTATASSSPPNMSGSAVLEIGRASSGATLAGARVRRVFMCPTSVAASCTDHATVTASAGANGSISPSGAVQFYGRQAFDIVPNSGYHVASVAVDGQLVGAMTRYTFSNVTGSHTISATFAAGDPPTALFFGSSTTVGEGTSSPVYRWSSLVAACFGWHEINEGISGTTMTQRSPDDDSAELRWQTDVVGQDPDVVLIQYGANDVTANVPLGTSTTQAGTFRNATRVVLGGIHAGLPSATIYVVEPQPATVLTANRGPYDTALAEGATNAGLPLIRAGLAFPAGQYMADEIHLTDTGHSELARYIANAINPTVAATCTF